MTQIVRPMIEWHWARSPVAAWRGKLERNIEEFSCSSQIRFVWKDFELSKNFPRVIRLRTKHLHNAELFPNKSKFKWYRENFSYKSTKYDRQRRERKESHTKNSFILIPITRWLRLCCAVLIALCFDMCIQRPLETVLILIWVRSFSFEFIFGFFVRCRQSLFGSLYIQINSIAFEIDEISPHTSVEQAAPKKAINY